MKPLETILNQHPRALPTSRDSYAETAAELSLCSQTCIACGDACLGEGGNLPQLVRCIRLNQDCADILAAAARLLTRQTETEMPLLRAQLHVCVIACDACADECAAHAAVHEHCATCAEACRACQECCNRMLAEIASPGGGIRDEPVTPAEESPAVLLQR